MALLGPGCDWEVSCQAHSCWMCAYAMLHNSSDLDTIDSFNMRVPSLWQSGRIHTRPGIDCLLLFHGCHGHTTCSLPDYRPTSHRSRRDSRSGRDWTGPYEYARPRLAPHGRHQFRGQPLWLCHDDLSCQSLGEGPIQPSGPHYLVRNISTHH